MALRTVLVPLDGSPLAEQALLYAEALARSTRARLLLVMVTPASGRPDIPRPTPEERQYLGRLLSRLSRAGLTVEVATFAGEPAEAVLLEASIRHPDLIVMATHGRSGLRRWPCGQVTEVVLARSPAPVLVARSWLVPLSWPPEGTPHVLVPLDGTSTAEEALPVAQKLAEALGGCMALLRAVDPGAADVGRQVREARDYLDRLAQLGPTGGTVVGTPVDRAADAILAACQELGPALVVMTMRGADMTGPMLGGTAETVLRRGSVPLVLTCPTPRGTARRLPYVTGRQLTV